MPTAAWVLIVIIAFALGIFLGIYIARKTMDKYLQTHSPINEEMIRQMLASMGQKPSEKRVRQITKQMKGGAKK